MTDAMFELPSAEAKSYRVELDYARERIEKSALLANKQ